MIRLADKYPIVVKNASALELRPREHVEPVDAAALLVDLATGVAVVKSEQPQQQQLVTWPLRIRPGKKGRARVVVESGSQSRGN